MDYIDENNIILILNEKNNNGNYPLLWCISENNIEMIKLIIDYAEKNNIILNINEKNNEGYFPLLESAIINNIEIIELLLNYANKYNIKLNINEKNKTEDYPLMWTIIKNNIESTKLLINYANKINTILEINNTNIKGYNPIILSCSNSDIMKLLIEYSNENNIILEINNKNSSGDYPLLYSSYFKNIETTKLIIDYAKEHNITLNINEKNNSGDYPLLYSTKNIEIMKLLIDYANKNNIILELNEKNNKGNYPLLCCMKNIKALKLLIDYANENNITLNLDEKNNNGYYPLLYVICRKDIEIDAIKILFEYAKNNNIILKIKEKDIKNKMKKKTSRIIKSFSEIKLEILQLLYEYKNINRLNVDFTDNSELEKIFNNMENKHLEIETKQKINKRISELISQNLVIAKMDFIADEYDQLDITKGEFLVVTDWNYEEGWVYGHRRNKEDEKGLFPKVFVELFNDEIIESPISKKEITSEYKIIFEEKVERFRAKDEMRMNQGITEIKINRNHLFDDAYNFIMKNKVENLKKRIAIKYIGEEGIDAGGLLRDFFYQISKEIGNPNYLLFYSSNNSYELEINSLSGYNPEHLNYFRFVGRIIGLAIFNRQYLSIPFNMLFYKKLLNLEMEFSDLELIDPEIFKNINILRNNDGVEQYGLTFSIGVNDCFNDKKTVELKENGSNIDVTDSNKNEYIDLLVNYKLNNPETQRQYEALKRGFYDFMPSNINSIFNEIDLK
eukprot:jgi/Orpsp1_1/1181767/evm.model.c7180000078511.1